MIVADTGAIIALLDRRHSRHLRLAAQYRSTRNDWVLPWAILPELDHLVPRTIGTTAVLALRTDLADGRFSVEWGEPGDLRRAVELDRAYPSLSLGLVDGVVMAVAERLDARAIVTLDVRDFGAVRLRGSPELWPRDLA